MCLRLLQTGDVIQGIPGIDKMADERILLEKKRVLIGCTGSVASIKIPMLIEQLSKSMFKVCPRNAF